MASNREYPPPGSEASGTPPVCPLSPPRGGPFKPGGNWLNVSVKSQPPSIPVAPRTGAFTPGARFRSLSAKSVMEMFWQVTTIEPGGDPGPAGPFLQKIRLDGSAFFIFGLTDASEYADTGRS